MDDLICLTDAQMKRIEPYFPLSHGLPCVDDRRVVSGIVLGIGFVIKTVGHVTAGLGFCLRV